MKQKLCWGYFAFNRTRLVWSGHVMICKETRD